MQAFALEAFEGLSGRLIGLGLLHGLWIGLVAASLVALAFQVCPRLTHQARHRILLVALLLVVIGPLVATPLHHALSSRPMKTAQASEPIIMVPGTSESLELPLPADRLSVHLGNRNERLSGSRALDRECRDFADGRSRAPVSSGPGCGVAGRDGRARRLSGVGRHEAYEGFVATHGRHRAAIQEIAAKLARRAQTEVPAASDGPSPVKRTVSLRPVSARDSVAGRLVGCGDGKRVEAILAHELAHARRLDHLVNLAQRLIEVVSVF